MVSGGGPLPAAAFLAVGVLWLTAQRATEPVPHPREHHGRGPALRSRGLQVLVTTFVATGAIFGAGLSVAPTMVTTMALAEQHVPRADLTEGMTWISTGLAVGVALGSAAAGWVVDAAGAGVGYAVPAGAGALAAVVAFWGHRRPAMAPERAGSPAPKAWGGTGAENRQEQRLA